MSFPFLSTHSDGCSLDLIITPRSSKNKLIGLYDSRLKVSIKAPPVDGKANEELIKFLARFFNLSKKAILIVNGHSGRKKRINLIGLSIIECEDKLRTAGITNE